MIFQKIRIQRYRSINDLSASFHQGKILVICGANNVGKTNFLRALELFFSLDANKFNAGMDIPAEIVEGSRGGGFNTTITGYFEDESKNKIEIRAIFKQKKDLGNILEIKTKKKKGSLSEKEAREIISNFRFIFIEASNIHIPSVIDEIIDEEVLPFGLDGLRRKQTDPLKKFEAFITSSKVAVEKLTKDIEKILNEFIIDIPGISSKDWKIKILFSEYERLREALSGIINFTLYDKNNREMESKGSGIQRIILLSLMKYIAEKTHKQIIWGIDEPEVFLQPALQKRVFEKLQGVAIKQQVILTTHSHHFVDLRDTKNTFLFEANHEAKTYSRKPKEVFYTTNTFIQDKISEYEKVQKIRTHLGIETNDAWNILPNNILVEGDEDKEYIKTFARKFGFEIPNVLVSGGATKIKGYLQFLREFCCDLTFKPKIRIILDHDQAGKTEYKSLESGIKNNKYREFDITLEYMPRCDTANGKDLDYEIEDFVYPEIIRQATNKFLSKEKYITLDKKEISKRFEVAYNKECILKFLQNLTKTNNPSKSAISFEDENRGIKKILCKNACEIIERTDLSKLDSEFPGVKKYIESICIFK